MLSSKAVFSSFSVNNLEEAKRFYTQILGLEIDNETMGLQLKLNGGGKLHVYQKDNHQPATFTVLNFAVDNIDEAVDSLLEQGIKFERYTNMATQPDEKGIFRSLSPDQGPDIAWFKDPAGNILSVLQSK